MASYQRKCGWILVVLCLALATPATSVAQSSVQHQYVLFPSVSGLETFDESDASAESSRLHAGISALYSYSGEHFRFLGEFLLSTHESELERLKAGWAPTDNAMLWFGRFHVPSRFWLHEFHHGNYIQTSITRPSLEEWEDESGPTPSHATGLQFEFEQILADESSIQYMFTAGLAPKFDNDKLVPYDVLDPQSGHRLSLAARVGFRPRFFDDMSYGLIGSWNEIEVLRPAVPGPNDTHRVDQLTAGVFADWRWDDLRLITSIVYFKNQLRSPDGVVNDDFVLAYAQPEYELREDLTLFGRLDAGIGEDHSPFLRMLPAFVAHRNMLGIRWDFARSQALKMEVADTRKQNPGEGYVKFKEVRLQWSAVIQ